MLKPTRVNETGLKAINAFLAANHKLGDNFVRDNLLAWAEDAEFQISEGNPACIEIPGIVSVTGAAIEFTIPDEGLDFAEVWQAWEDGARDEAVEFLVPEHGGVDVAALGAAALGVDVSESLNVARI